MYEFLEEQLYQTNTQTTHKRYTIMTPEAERFNGWAAMLGLVAGFISYVTTGNFFFGGILGF